MGFRADVKLDRAGLASHRAALIAADLGIYHVLAVLATEPES
ncbi:MAG: hypothetical protein R3256_06120 [Thalassovita sp.]|nr:hypothetical protein [Thalassovita sp.]